MSVEELRAAGYYYCSPNRISWPCSDGFYQKRIRSKEGTRYFINMVHYPAIAGSGESFMCDVTLNEPHSTLELHRPESLAWAEAKAEEFWRMMGSIYYESHDPTP